MTRRILITGGFGYVGSRIAQVIATLPDTQVILGSREARVSPSWLRNSTVLTTSWLDSSSLARACSGVDVVVHLAAMNEIDAASNPIGALEMNGLNSVRLLEAAKSEGVSKFIFLSTAHIYGAPLRGFIDENTLPRPIHPYATSHKAAEDAILASHDQGFIDGIVLRLSNGFGAPAHAGVNRWSLLVNDLCQQAVTHGKLTMRSTGMQRRDFVTLHDVSRAFCHFVDMPKDKIGNGIFNIGGSWAPRIIDVAEMVQSRCAIVLGFTPAILRPAPQPDEKDTELTYSIDKLLSTGFNLSGNPREEIDATLELCLHLHGSLNA